MGMLAANTSIYNEYFHRFSAEFFGADFDWTWFRAQAIAESDLDPLAVSPAGAIGLMQLMPGTYADMTKRLGLPPGQHTAALIHDPETNIRCGIAYNRRCWNIWKKEAGIERLRFMFASYNAGPGHIVKAQRLAAMKDKWSSVSACLHRVTGWDDAPETINYVRRIERLHGPV